MGQDTEIRIERHGQTTLFEVLGDVTAAAEPAFRKAYEGEEGQAAKNILLKFEPTAYINSGGIAVLIQLLARAKQRNQQIGITGLSEHFKKIFRMVGITKFAKVYDSTGEALSMMSGGT